MCESFLKSVDHLFLFFFSDALQDEMIIDPAIVDKLTHGTLALFLPNLQKAKGSLNEVL